MEIESVLVTGANRGIGLEFVRQFAASTNPPKWIFATYRNETSSQALKEIQKSSIASKVHLIQMDVTNVEEIKHAIKQIEEVVGDRGLTLLINNAGICEVSPFENITDENLLKHFKANTVAPILITQHILPLLEKSSENSRRKGFSISKAAVLNMTSKTSSLKNTGEIFTQDKVVMGYKISKAGLNMSMRIIAMQLKAKEILVVTMCPGWVKTDMGTNHAEIEVKESIHTMFKVMQTLNEEHHGSFVDRYGEPIPF